MRVTLCPRAAMVLAMAAGGIFPASAHAQDAPAGRQDLTRYIRSELVINTAFVAAGVADTAVGAWLLTQGDPMAHGAGYPVVVFGGVQLVFGAVYLAVTPGRAVTMGEHLARDPGGYQRDERSRVAMLGTIMDWVLVADGASALAGGITLGLGLAAHDDGTTGVGAGLAISGVVELALDLATQVANVTHGHTLAGLHLGMGPRGPALSLAW